MYLDLRMLRNVYLKEKLQRIFICLEVHAKFNATTLLN